MQFSCESCKAQLQIADEKVRGKRLIVRCKRCGAKISISDPAISAARPRMVAGPPGAAPRSGSAPSPAAPSRPSPAASPAPLGHDSDTDTDSTRAMDSDLLEQALQASKVDEPTLNSATPSAGSKPAPSERSAPPVAEPAWFAMLHGKQTGPLTPAELVARSDEGAVGPRTYLWKDGMNAWQRAKDLPELGGLFPQLPEAAPSPPSAAPPPAAALREFSSPDFASKPQPAGPTKPPASHTPAEAARPGKLAASPTPAETARLTKPAASPAKAEAVRPTKPAASPGQVEAVRPGKPAASRAPGKGERSFVEPLPLEERAHQEGVARELFAPEKGSAQKSVDLASWAAGELEKKSSPPRPSVMPDPRMFEGASEPGNRGPFVLVVLGVVALAAVVLWLVLLGGARASQPLQGGRDAGATPPLATPGPAVPSRDEKPSAKPKPEPPAVTGLTADQVRRKLDENKGALQGCIDEALRRDPNLRVGKIHISTTIAPTGAVTQARIDKNTVEQSPLGACLRRATKKIVFPTFNGGAFDVDIPIVVTAGE